MRIGDYDLEAKIGDSRWGPVYRAAQRSVHRVVALKTVAPEVAALPGKAEQFLEEMRAAARLVHAGIVAIYEAGQADGVHYCAMEHMEGPPLPEFLRKGDVVDERRLLQIIATVARVYDFLWQRNLPHQPPEARNILTDARGHVKLIHVLPLDNPPSGAPREDILALGLVLAQLANDISPVSKPVSELVERMVGAGGRKPFGSLGELADAATALERQLFPPEAPPAPVIEKIQARKTKPAVLVAWMMVAVLIGAGVLVWQVRRAARPDGPVWPARPADFGTMMPVDGFWIDRYPVTLGQYREFLDAIAGGLRPPEHPFAGRRKDHTPANWSAIVHAIEQRLPLNEVWLSWDSPVFAVDWFDAYSYAAWKGKRLPTEDEWRRAGLAETPASQKWAPVYVGSSVMEWTATASRDSAVVCGRSERSELPRETRSEVIGFRCASDKEVK